MMKIGEPRTSYLDRNSYLSLVRNESHIIISHYPKYMIKKISSFGIFLKIDIVRKLQTITIMYQ